MKISLLLLSVCLPAFLAYSERDLLQFRDMIKCTLPDSSPLADFGDYGCFCGQGGQGTPVDELDRCCFVHDGCYGDAQNHSSCEPIVDSPYFNRYHFQCDAANKTVTCLASNDVCEMFICECDRKAAECFAVAPYNETNNHLPSSVCSAAPTHGLSLTSLLAALAGLLLVLPLEPTATAG